MFRSQPYRRVYTGPIILDSQPNNWIRKHRSFASREWLQSQVRYGEWTATQNKPNHYRIYATVIEGRKQIKVLIQIRHCETHVLVYHAHVL